MVEKRNGVVKPRMEQIFTPTTIQIFNLFNNNHHHNHEQEYINNITGIAGDVDLSPVTVRKHLTPMVGTGILKELVVGNNGKVFALNRDSAVTRAFITLINMLKEKEGVICGEKGGETHIEGEGR